MSELTEKSAKRIIKARKLVNEPGTYELKVEREPNFHATEERSVYIVNLGGVTPYQLSKAHSLFSEGKYQEAANEQLTTNVRVSKEGEIRDYLPSKGEYVQVRIENVQTKSGETGLFVTSMTKAPVKEAKAVSLDWLNDTEDEVTNEFENSKPEPNKVVNQ
jgi:hypothetical protein